MKISVYFFLFITGIFSPLFVGAQYDSEDWEERNKWMDVDRLMELAGVMEGQQVADIGCHEGYFTIHLARRLGAEGKVYAVDVREDRLGKLRENARSRNLGNIEPVLGDYDDPKLPANTLDLVVIMDTYHEIREYQTVLKHVRKSLKPTGKILVLEKLKTHVKGKSRKEQTSAHSLSPEYVRTELEEAGFELISEVDDLGNWQNNQDKKIWAIIAKLPGA